MIDPYVPVTLEATASSSGYAIGTSGNPTDDSGFTIRDWNRRPCRS
jgi:hypothetical protein